MPRAARRGPAPGPWTGTPLSNLNSAISEGDRSPGDSAREQGTLAYDEAMKAMAKHADSFDAEWSRFASACSARVTGGAFEREWFALYEPRTIRMPISPGCEDARAQFRAAAEAFRARMADLDDAARRAGVYPGASGRFARACASSTRAGGGDGREEEDRRQKTEDRRQYNSHQCRLSSSCF